MPNRQPKTPTPSVHSLPGRYKEFSAGQRPPRKLTHLEVLESESIHILREVAAECSNPALLSSGGKDSLVLLRLAEKAFRPARFPFPLLHIDTGHNFPEVLGFRDHRAAELGERLIVCSIEDSIVQPTRPDRDRARFEFPGLSFPVQWVCRPESAEGRDFRGYMGRIEVGTIGVGDTVRILPSDRSLS